MGLHCLENTIVENVDTARLYADMQTFFSRLLAGDYYHSAAHQKLIASNIDNMHLVSRVLQCAIDGSGGDALRSDLDASRCVYARQLACNLFLEGNLNLIEVSSFLTSLCASHRTLASQFEQKVGEMAYGEPKFRDQDRALDLTQRLLELMGFVFNQLKFILRSELQDRLVEDQVDMGDSEVDVSRSIVRSAIVGSDGRVGSSVDRPGPRVDIVKGGQLPRSVGAQAPVRPEVRVERAGLAV
jgi:hypothetical protein